MAKKALPFRIDEDLLRRVDEARGDVPRTRWVTRAIEAALDVRPVPLSALGPNPPFEAVKASAAEARRVERALEARESVAAYREKKKVPLAFDPNAAALERQRKLNKARDGS
jgi:hypothetical protein